jgi:putative transposase
VKYSPLIACQAQRRKSATSSSWRMDETYIQVKGKWTYFYRAVDKFGKTLDFMLSEHRDEAAASAFFARTIKNNGWPERSSSTRAARTWQDCKTSTGGCCCMDGSG